MEEIVQDMERIIIPSTFDPRLISVIPAVAQAAMKSGAARKK